MSKAYLVAFVMIAGVAVAGVDYVNQARVAGEKPGRFAVGDYLATISGRFVSQQQAVAEAAERQTLLAMDLRDHLPEAPEGWTRRAWDDAAAAELDPKRYDMAKDDFLPDEIKQDPTMKALSALDKAAKNRTDATEVYVYEKPGALIAIHLRLSPKGGTGGIAGMAMQKAANNIEALSSKAGFAVVKGVTYREEHGLLGTGASQRSYRVFTGAIGDRIRISIRAQSEERDILELLGQIDYDRLNALLDAPVAEIGTAAPDLDPAQTRALAEERVAADATAQRAATLEQQNRTMIAALELNHRIGSISDADYEMAKAKLDAQVAKSNAIMGTMQQTPALDQTAAFSEKAAGGGLWGMIAGVFGGAKGNASAETPTAAPPTEVKINRIGASNCKLSSGVKRCSIGGN